MEIARVGSYLELGNVDPFLAELLRQIPGSTDAGENETARKRLFSAPAKANETELCREWQQLVEPELKRLFQSSTETVASDLEQLDGNRKPFANCRLRIPLEHADAWLNTLNQARLVIAAKYEFSDGELSDHYRSPMGSRRDLSLFQVNFYGFLQECILREIMS
jgi:hypothetical protein